MALEKYDILVVDPNRERRMRLKAATASVTSFGSVALCSEFKKGLEVLKEGEQRIIVFVGPESGEKSIRAFIDEAKQIPQGQDSAYLLLLSGDTGKAGLTSSILDGCDGVLIEPFSVDSLVEVTTIAASTHRQRRRAREEAALAHLVPSALNALDSIATSKVTGSSPGEKVRDFRLYGKAIHGLDESLRAYYFNLLIKETEVMNPPQELISWKKKEKERLEQEAEKERLARLHSDPTRQNRAGANRIVKKG
jgi:hypothetical protein